MKVCHTLICCFFLSLQNGNTGQVKAQLFVYSGTEGRDVTVRCPFFISETQKIFCKEPCKRKDILIQTARVRAQKGRYSIKYEGGSVLVTITQLTKSDSGRYSCGLGRTSSSVSYMPLEIIVTDALLTGEEKLLYTRPGADVTVECSFPSSGRWKIFCKEECGGNDLLIRTHDETDQRDRYSIRYLTGSPSGGFVFVTMTQLTTSDSGRYRCGLGTSLSSVSYRFFEIIVTDVPSTSKPPTTTTQSLGSSSFPESTNQSETRAKDAPDVTLYVGLTLLIMFVLLSVTALIFWRKRTPEPKEPPVETEYTSVTEMNRACEDVGEEGGQRRPNDHSFVTAAGSQHRAEDDSGKLTYAEVSFSNRRAGSSHSAPHSNTEDVVYSVPHARGRSNARHARGDQPLYSTVAFRQK